MEKEKVRRITTIELVYPVPLPEPEVVEKKTLEMTNLDWKEVTEAMAEKLDTLIHPELAELAIATREAMPVPYARFDVTAFDRCQFF